VFSVTAKSGLLVLIVLVMLERPGGEIRRRTDAKNREYYEVFADALNGNHAGPAPMHIVNGQPQWPKSIQITVEDTWRIARDPERPVGAGGKAGSGCPSCPSPNQPWGALIARWVKLDMTKLPTALNSLPTEPVSEWFVVSGAASFQVPTAAVAPRPYRPLWLGLYPGLPATPELYYTPLLALQYRCNDSEMSDNDGWLHVYQVWTW